MSQEQKEKEMFMVNDFVYHLYHERKIDLNRYMETLQLIQKCGECDAGLGDVSNLFILL